MTLKKYIGDKKFYKMVLTVALPIMIQNGISNFVNLLDNIMVGRLGTEAMSGVNIVNQFLFVFNLIIFGAISSAGIFTAQFHGNRDVEGEKYTFRFKMIISLLMGIVGILAFYFFDSEFISLFLHDGSAEGDLALTLEYGKEYLGVMLIGLIPFAISQVYASTLRETEETILPMLSGMIAVFVNLALNYVFIFGHFGAPALGVRGAAVATVISRFVELAILVVWTHRHKEKCGFIVGVYRSLYMPRALIMQIVIRGLPLMVNEFLWSFSVTFTNQCYSLRGIEVVAALNIATTISNVFGMIYISLGTSIAIVVGNLLGAGKIEEAKDTDRKMIAFSIFCSVAVAILLVCFSSLFPMAYNTTETAKKIASYMIIVTSLVMPVDAFANAAYFTLRSGGKVLVTMLFDSVFMWVIVVPTAFCLSRFTGMNIFWLYLACRSLEILKAAFGAVLLKKGNWVTQLVADDKLKS